MITVELIDSICDVSIIVRFIGYRYERESDSSRRIRDWLEESIENRPNGSPKNIKQKN